MKADAAVINVQRHLSHAISADRTCQESSIQFPMTMKLIQPVQKSNLDEPWRNKEMCTCTCTCSRVSAFALHVVTSTEVNPHRDFESHLFILTKIEAIERAKKAAE